MRVDGRAWNEMRAVRMNPGFIKVMTGDGRLVEVQGTAEGAPFRREVLAELIDLAWYGVEHLLAIQQGALRAAAAREAEPS